MRHLPILIDLAGRPCLVVGGGAVAARKIETLLGVGARVLAVAPHFAAEIESLAATSSALELERRPYREGDLDGMALAFAATDDAGVQDRIARDARAAGVWLNAVDDPERCSFIMPAILSRGPLVVAVGTSGASPGLAGRIRDEIGSFLGPEYESAVEHLARLRACLAPGPARQAAFRRMIDGGLLEALRAADHVRVESLTRSACAGLARREPAAGDEAP